MVFRSGDNHFERGNSDREGKKEYWMPVQRPIHREMKVSLSRNALITIDTILMGTVSSAGSVEWIFMIGGFKK